MKNEKPRYLVNRTYTEVTPESAENGDFSDSGMVYENEPHTLESLLHELQDCSELSVSPATQATIRSRTWASTQYDTEDYTTDTQRQESVHIRLTNGEISPRRLWHIYKLAGLAE